MEHNNSHIPSRDAPDTATLLKRFWQWVTTPRSISMFLLVGIFNTLVGVLLFPLLHWMFGEHVAFDLLLAVSYVLCTLSSFLLHKYVTFKSKGSAVTEGIKFAALSGFTYVLNLIILHLVVPLLPWNKVLIQTIIAVALQAGNYFGMNRLVFASLSSFSVFKKWLSPKNNP
ncbi:MAG: GtrA family protein [Alphaproteobacteria bacterium]|nr:GtrA family protein [Alphaproteobacteria bacterium]